MLIILLATPPHRNIAFLPSLLSPTALATQKTGLELICVLIDMHKLIPHSPWNSPLKHKITGKEVEKSEIKGNIAAGNAGSTTIYMN